MTRLKEYIVRDYVDGYRGQRFYEFIDLATVTPVQQVRADAVEAMIGSRSVEIETNYDTLAAELARR